jgi:biopolymer transport protein ExbD
MVLVVSHLLLTLGHQKSLDVQLPVYTAASTRFGFDEHCDNQIILTCHASGDLSINHVDVKREGLAARLRQIYERRSCKSIYIAAAPTLPYGEIAGLVDSVKGAGIYQIVMIPHSPEYAHLFR